ncbi:MAG: MATE family efflux transporter [Pseudomonadota bacterium]
MDLIDSTSTVRNVEIYPSKSNSFSRFLSNVRDGYPELLRVALPLILSTSSLTLTLFVDRLMLSRHGIADVAAVTPGGITYFTICCFFQGTAQYTNALVAVKHGTGDKIGCSKVVWQGIWFSLISFPFLMASIPLGCWVLGNTGHAPNLIELEKEYFRILMYSSVALPLNAALSSFFSGRGRTSPVLIGNLIGNAANIVLDYLLIFGNFGFPELGIKGAGIATAITNFFPTIYWAFLFLGKRFQKEFRTRKEIRFDKASFRTLLRFGLPSGAQFFLDIGAFTAFVLIVGKISEIDLAATNIALSIETLSFLPMVGLSTATCAIVGKYIGSRRVDIAEQRVTCAIGIALFYTGVVAIIFWVAPEYLLKLFMPYQGNPDDFEPLMTRGITLVRIIAVYTLFDTIFIIFNGALKGAGDTRFAMWAQVVMAWFLFVPPVYFMVTYFELGIFAAWSWLLLYVVGIGAIFWLRFRSGHWKTIQIY